MAFEWLVFERTGFGDEMLNSAQLSAQITAAMRHPPPHSLSVHYAVKKIDENGRKQTENVRELFPEKDTDRLKKRWQHNPKIGIDQP